MSWLHPPRRSAATICLIALLAGCGGGGSDGGSGAAASTPAPTPTPTSATAGCSLRERQDWAAAQLREWYLFPETLPAALDPAGYASVADYADALTATARGQGRDRYFTYVTSIAEENAYYQSGSSAGFGFRLGYDLNGGRLFVTESFENTPALAAGIDRGSEIVAIGPTASNLTTVSALYQSRGAAGISEALGPPTVGDARVLRVRAPDGGQRDVTIAKAEYTVDPVSTRYGARIIDDGGRRVGYINLRAFISPANQALRDAFAQFRAAGITEVIVDLRYNGGGLVSVANTLGDLLGGNRATSEVFSYVAFRSEKSAENETRNFAPQPQSIAPNRIAFIGTGDTASASELVINAFTPFLHANAALIGANTFGKPVGQIALDRAACDDRLRVVAFATQNAARRGDYYTGLAPVMERTCAASDDLNYPLGDAREASVQQALAFLAGRSCTPIGGASASAATTRSGDVAVQRTPLMPPRPMTAQREVPGAY